MVRRKETRLISVLSWTVTFWPMKETQFGNNKTLSHIFYNIYVSLRTYLFLLGLQHICVKIPFVEILKI